ncbi:hypothetical protein [Merismopedia glauca]|uniref:hypothetical protein n=1 Tax=Merismopedia glauca TaxID=292586 RepID=UPI001C62B71F|nr:hypothetical protein [Merismopedia glauca]
MNAKNHHYTVDTVLITIQLLIKCGTSFRGIEKTLELFNNLESQKTPSFTCIRKWLGRIGLYELRREQEYRSDWIFIVDFTLELGKQKALVVLGVSQQHLVEQIIPDGRGLSHEDVELLGLYIMESTTGEIIKQKLDEITLQVGRPIQIVADHGSDLARGIKLYQEEHEDLIYTHDVTHAMALLLKYELNSDDKYQSFIQKCNMCRQQLQQTELSFLSPPTQRSQCRYFNIERLTDWGLNLLNCPIDTVVKLVENSDPGVINKKLINKLGWLVDYQVELIRWHQMTVLTRTLETQLKKLGINQQSLTCFQENEFTFAEGELLNFQQHICDYVVTQSSHIKDEKTFLATSDVIESLFGKYKHFSARCPFKEMSQMLLTICLSTMNLTNTIVKNALESISFADVEAWLAEVFGQSMLSKRKTLFSKLVDDTETA